MEEKKDGVGRNSRQPELVTGVMLPYQIKGMEWMAALNKEGINGILADEVRSSPLRPSLLSSSLLESGVKPRSSPPSSDSSCVQTMATIYRLVPCLVCDLGFSWLERVYT